MEQSVAEDMPPGAAGFEAILAGARARLNDGDALPAGTGTVSDSLYTRFSHQRAS